MQIAARYVEAKGEMRKRQMMSNEKLKPKLFSVMKNYSKEQQSKFATMEIYLRRKIMTGWQRIIEARYSRA